MLERSPYFHQLKSGETPGQAGSIRRLKTASISSGSSSPFSRQTDERKLEFFCHPRVRPKHAGPDSLQIPCFSLFGRSRRSIQPPELPYKSANRSKTDSSKWRNSLKISLFSGSIIRDEFDADCVHRHLLLSGHPTTSKRRKKPQRKLGFNVFYRPMPYYGSHAEIGVPLGVFVYRGGGMTPGG